MRRQDAVDTVGKALFAQHWVESLSHREWWLIDSYRSPSFGDVTYPSSIESGLPIVPPALRDELDRAIDRQAWLEDQLGACHNWLVNSGFPDDLEEIDREKFDEKFAGYFRIKKPTSLSIPTKKTAEAFVRDFIVSTDTPTLLGCRAASRARFRGRRDVIDEAYHAVARELEISVKQGPRRPRRNVRENAAE
jgi:hypothetical protein